VKLTRRRFTAGAFAVAGLRAAPAGATGGADIEQDVIPHTIRILLASGYGIARAQQVDSWRFTWNGRTFRGIAQHVTLPGGRPALVNAAPLDAYLYGVLSAEVSAAWPRASQHAQAVAARSYALEKIKPDRQYDLVSSELDQRYLGFGSETVEGKDAVDATSGEILLYGFTPARVAYSACCGGHTADGALTWGVPAPYLRGVRDPYCFSSPAYAWSTTVGYDELERAFGAGGVRRVDLLNVDSSGRPQEVALSGARSVDVRTAEFRAALGLERVRSTLIRSAFPSAAGVIVNGNGFGHGVGLCQWGAREMGKLGATKEQILAFYFPGTSIGPG
jgi:stage II sporulation protein D